MMMSNIKILIFPIDMEESRKFILTMKSLNIDVFGASSVVNSTDILNIDKIIELPFITDQCFDLKLYETLSSYAISHIFTPHVGVWLYLDKLGKAFPERYHFQLCQPSPFTQSWQEFEFSYDWANKQHLSSFVGDIENKKNIKNNPPLSVGQITSLHRQFLQIPGQCDTQKLSALMQILRMVPDGDLVEVGVYFGRSAFVIAWLAQQYNLGNLICIDPWENSKIEDQGDSASILPNNLSQESGGIDFEKVFQGFVSVMSLLSNVSYIKDVSQEGIKHYKESSKAGLISTPEFGTISLSGKIAMIHIDGNHRYDLVREDIRAWEPLVIVDGWILIDDYVWAFGDGPKKAGDELLATGRFDVSFCLGNTLFLRKSQM